MANGIAPDTLPGHRRSRRRRSQWLGLAVVIAGIAVATIVVPPLIAPRHHPPSSASSPTPPTPPAGPANSAVVRPAESASPAARFAPITVEAEDPHNILSGGAAATSCSTCRGGRRVRYLCDTCQVVVRTEVPVAGRRTVTVVYEADGDRKLKVRVNGGPARTWPVAGSDWTTPHSFRFTADLPAGPLRLTLFNDESPAPDVDQVAIS